MGLREENATRTRAALLTAARDAFADHGFEGASIRAIAAEAGVATGTVFRYAEGKLDLLHQVLHDDLEAVCRSALATPDGGELIEQLDGLAAPFLEHFAATPELSRVLLKESLFAQGASGAAFRDQVDRVARDAQRRIAAARARSEVHAPIGPSTLLFVSAYYFALLQCLAADAPDATAARRQLRLQLTLLLPSDP
jgi:AcrR family transcriptional regulator